MRWYIYFVVTWTRHSRTARSSADVPAGARCILALAVHVISCLAGNSEAAPPNLIFLRSRPSDLILICREARKEKQEASRDKETPHKRDPVRYATNLINTAWGRAAWHNVAGRDNTT